MRIYAFSPLLYRLLKYRTAKQKKKTYLFFLFQYTVNFIKRIRIEAYNDDDDKKFNIKDLLEERKKKKAKIPHFLLLLLVSN